MKSFKTILDESKSITIDVDYTCDDKKECDKLNKQHRVKVKSTGKTTADVTGKKENIIAWMKASGYEDIKELYPELFKK